MICSKEKCTGCEACYCVCPKNAITMQEDDYGNIYLQNGSMTCAVPGVQS